MEHTDGEGADTHKDTHMHTLMSTALVMETLHRSTSGEETSVVEQGANTQTQSILGDVPSLDAKV